MSEQKEKRSKTGADPQGRLEALVRRIDVDRLAENLRKALERAQRENMRRRQLSALRLR